MISVKNLDVNHILFGAIAASVIANIVFNWLSRKKAENGCPFTTAQIEKKWESILGMASSVKETIQRTDQDGVPKVYVRGELYKVMRAVRDETKVSNALLRQLIEEIRLARRNGRNGKPKEK